MEKRAMKKEEEINEMLELEALQTTPENAEDESDHTIAEAYIYTPFPELTEYRKMTKLRTTWSKFEQLP